jgi:hypothetical protein
MSDVTQILNSVERGDERATDKRLSLVYAKLRTLADQKLTKELPGQPLSSGGLPLYAPRSLVKAVSQDGSSTDA